MEPLAEPLDMPGDKEFAEELTGLSTMDDEEAVENAEVSVDKLPVNGRMVLEAVGYMTPTGADELEPAALE